MKKIVAVSDKYNAHVTTTGYDYHFNDEFMIQCAAQTGGNACLLKRDDINQLLKIVNKEVTLIKSIAYKDIYLELDLPSGVTVGNVSGGIRKDNKIFIRDLPPKYVKPLFIRLHGRPARSKDIAVQAGFSTMNNVRKESLRKYIDLKVHADNGGYNKDFAPSILVYTTLQELNESLHYFRKGKLSRDDCAILLNNKLFTLEQTKWKLHSNYFNWSFYVMQGILFAVRNEAFEDELVIKIINYSFTHYLSGFQIR